jgi:hypothetical protein
MTQRSLEAWASMARRIAEAPCTKFTDLVEVAGLDPSNELRNANLSGVSFADCDLSGYDLTAATLIGCDFSGAKVSERTLRQIVVDRALVGASRNPNAAAPEMLGISRFGRETLLSQATVAAAENPRSKSSRLQMNFAKEALTRIQEISDLFSTYGQSKRGKSRRLAQRTNEIAGSPTSQTEDLFARSSETHLRPGVVFQDAIFAPRMIVVPSEVVQQGDEGIDTRGMNRGEGTISYRLAVGRYPITFGEWDACYAGGGTRHRPVVKWDGRRGPLAVVDVSLKQITRDYLPWLNSRLGLAGNKGYRLMSVRESNYCCFAPTLKVGSFTYNAWGLAVLFNFNEWCQPFDSSETHGVISAKVSWRHGSTKAEARHFKQSMYPSDDATGFRVARTLSF